MNNLSWFLYLADVLGSVKDIFMILTVFGAVGGVVGIIGHACWAYDEDKPFQWKIFWISPLLFFFMTISIGIPSQKTMYLMMGSEVTEMAATSEIGQEVLTTTKEIILQKLKEFKEGQ